MTTNSASTDPIPPGTLKTLAGHVAALLLPVATLAFLASGPHTPLAALSWTLPLWALVAADVASPRYRGAPRLDRPSWPFDALLYGLAGLQFANIALMVRMVSLLDTTGPDSWIDVLCNLLAVRILVGTTSCCSGISVAHELIHRRGHVPRLIGRALLSTVCYMHFAVEHLRGHHRHVGTADDPATARLGESYRAYWRRTKLEQFANAWRMETGRLGVSAARPRTLLRLIRHEVAIGLALQIALVATIGALAGPLAAAMFLLQALAAVRLLEAVNYFQHWGLRRDVDSLQAIDTWTTDSWVTQHVFVGLARHADHHRNATTPYQMLRHCDQGPSLPYGYFGMAFLAKSFNRRYQRRALAELRDYRARQTQSRTATFRTADAGCRVVP
ncbi:MAG: alkane 1-monooxygenase [Methylotetracoccus sp.]